MLSAAWESREDQLLETYKSEISADEIGDHEFLTNLGFVSDGGLTPLGEQYIEERFVYESQKSKQIMREQLLGVTEINSLLQSFYGQDTKRGNVEVFLQGRYGLEGPEVGRLLLLLNRVGLVSYSKKTGRVRFSSPETLEVEDQDRYTVSRRTPYSNVKRLRRVLRQCDGDIFWLDKHLSKKALEPLSDVLGGGRIEQVQLLSGPANVTSKFRSDFKRFNDEMENRGIQASAKVMVDSDTLHAIHDRWIISSGPAWNLPPIDTIFQNQEAEILRGNPELPLDDWWEGALDLVEEWNEIQKHL